MALQSGRFIISRARLVSLIGKGQELGGAVAEMRTLDIADAAKRAFTGGIHLHESLIVA
ncbi:hypothetical protein [Acidithiobacillus sp.]